MRKRVFSLLLVGALAAGLLAGCGSNSKEQESDSVVQSEQITDEKEPEEETSTSEKTATEDTVMEEIENDEADGKTIVVYFSATGNTEQVAAVIAEATGGELFELEPVEPYTDADLDWTDENSRVGREHDDPEQRGRAGLHSNRWLGGRIYSVYRLPCVVGDRRMASEWLC